VVVVGLQRGGGWIELTLLEMTWGVKLPESKPALLRLAYS